MTDIIVQRDELVAVLHDLAARKHAADTALADNLRQKAEVFERATGVELQEIDQELPPVLAEAREVAALPVPADVTARARALEQGPVEDLRRLYRKRGGGR